MKRLLWRSLCESVPPDQLAAVAQRLWSSEAEGFISQNDEVLGVIDQISSRAKKRGTTSSSTAEATETGCSTASGSAQLTTSRLRGQPHLFHGRGGPRCCKNPAASLPHEAHRDRRGHDGVKSYKAGVRRHDSSPRPQRPGCFAHGRGEGPSSGRCLADHAGRRRRASPRGRSSRPFDARWRVEDAIRFVKQSHNLEDIRVLRRTGA